MKNKKVNILLLTVLSVSTLLVSIIGASFAYFTATATSEEAETIVVGAGKLNIDYASGSSHIEPVGALEVLPSITGDAYAVKEFTITGNNTTVGTNMPYSLHLNVTTNQFETDMMTYTLTSSGVNGTVVPAQTVKKGLVTGPHVVDFGTGEFAGQVTDQVHTYELSLYFDDNDANQDPNKGAEFAAHIDVKVAAINVSP